MSDEKNPVLPEEENLLLSEEPDLSQSDVPEETADAPAEKKPRVKSRFLQFLLIWLAVLLVLGGVTCFVLYRYAAVYEETRPEKPMEQLMESMSKDDWLDKAAPSSKMQTRFSVSITTLLCGIRISLFAKASLSLTRHFRPLW